MSFLSFLAPVVGSVLGGLLGNQGSQQAAQTAGNDALAQSQQAFNDYTNYANQQQQGLKNQITSLGTNPFISALSQLKAPNPSANTYTPVGMSGVPMYGAGGGSTGAAAGSPTGAAAGGAMPTGSPYQGNPFAQIAQRRQAQPMMRGMGQ